MLAGQHSLNYLKSLGFVALQSCSVFLSTENTIVENEESTKFINFITSEAKPFHYQRNCQNRLSKTEIHSIFLKRVSQSCLNELGLTASQYPNIGLLFFMINGFEIQSYFLMKDRLFYHTIFFSLPLITYSDHFYMTTLINFYKKLL